MILSFLSAVTFLHAVKRRKNAVEASRPRQAFTLMISWSLSSSEWKRWFPLWGVSLKLIVSRSIVSFTVAYVTDQTLVVFVDGCFYWTRNIWSRTFVFKWSESDDRMCEVRVILNKRCLVKRDQELELHRWLLLRQNEYMKNYCQCILHRQWCLMMTIWAPSSIDFTKSRDPSSITKNFLLCQLQQQQ